MSTGDRAELASAVIAAINSREPDRLAALLDPGVEVVTGRNVHSGPGAALAWAAKAYDHLDRRYAVAPVEIRGDEVLLLGEVQYVWRDDGTVGDSSPIALTLSFDRDLLRRLRVEDDPDSALSAFQF